MFYVWSKWNDTFCRGPHKHHPSKIYFNWQSSFSRENIFYIGQSETRMTVVAMLSVNQNQKQNFVEDLLSIGFNWPNSFRRLKCKRLRQQTKWRQKLTGLVFPPSYIMTEQVTWDEMTTVCTNTLRRIFLVLAHCNKSEVRHVAPLVHIILNLSPSVQYQFYKFWLWPKRGLNPRSTALGGEHTYHYQGSPHIVKTGRLDFSILT